MRLFTWVFTVDGAWWESVKKKKREINTWLCVTGERADVSLLMFVWGPDWSLSWQRETLTCVAVDSQKKERKTLAGDGGGDFITLQRLITAKDTLVLKFPRFKNAVMPVSHIPKLCCTFRVPYHANSLSNNNNCLLFLETHMEIAPLIMSQRALICRRCISPQFDPCPRSN